MSALVLQGNALNLPLPDDSVDLIVTSPPYFALRSYQDEGKHYDGQIGSESTPKDFLDALVAATAEMKRVLKPSGSIFVNLGDKYAGSGGHNNSGISDKSTLQGNGHKGGVGKAGPQKIKATRRSAPDRYNQNTTTPAKSLELLPHRYAIRCVDELGLICRQDQVWSKPNGLPESVTDRTRRSHEYWFHFTKSPRYFSAIDEIREAQSQAFMERTQRTWNPSQNNGEEAAQVPGESERWRVQELAANPLGKLPGSVWTIPTEPLKVPAHLGIDHFAAFPTEWPRRLILGWSPSGICVECGEGRRPVVDKSLVVDAERAWGAKFNGTKTEHQHNRMGTDEPHGSTEATILGYACGCAGPWSNAGQVRPVQSWYDKAPPTTSAVVLDPFGGTGTTALVAKTLDRIGITVDLSADYCRLAQWRIFKSGHGAKAMSRTNLERQGNLL